jgi:hypothetical protein
VLLGSDLTTTFFGVTGIPVRCGKIAPNAVAVPRQANSERTLCQTAAPAAAGGAEQPG